MILFFIDLSAHAQARMGFEQYYYPADPRTFSSLSSRLFYEENDGWSAELRLNYEEERTVACSIGRSFKREKKFSYSFTPAVGLAAGKHQGVSVGLNASLAYKGLYLSSFIQHVSCFEKERSDFIFSWWELNVQVVKHLNAGLAVQQTSFNHGGLGWDPGGKLSISFGSWTFPLYFFKPAASHCYFVAGLCREWKDQHGSFFKRSKNIL